MKSNRALFGFVLLAVFGLALLAACGRKAPAEKASEKMVSDMIAKATGGKADIDFKKGQINVKTEDGGGTITLGGGAWPADLPEEVPPFTAGAIRGTSNSDSGQGRTWLIVFDDVEAEEAAAYVEGLKSDGWNVMMSSDVPQGTYTQLQNGDVMLQVTSSTEENTLTLNVIRQKGD